MVTPARTQPGTREERRVDPVTGEDEATDSPWVTLVWDDPVNLMSYVTYVFQKLFGYSEPHATKLMMQVHEEGKAVVSAGSRESMEVDVAKLHARAVGHDAAGPLRRRAQVETGGHRQWRALPVGVGRPRVGAAAESGEVTAGHARGS